MHMLNDSLCIYLWGMLCSSTAVLSGADLLTPLLGVGATPVDDTEINKINKVIVNEFLKLRIVTAAVIKVYRLYYYSKNDKGW